MVFYAIIGDNRSAAALAGDANERFIVRYDVKIVVGLVITIQISIQRTCDN